MDDQRAKRTRVLRHRADRWTLAVVFAVLGLRLALVGYERPVSAGLVAVAVLTMPVIWAIKHNAIHVTVFADNRLDRWYRGVLTVLTGTSSANTSVVHTAIHHRYNNGPRDWTAVGLAPRFRWRLLRLIAYPVPVVRSLAARKQVYLADKPLLRRRIKAETALAVAGLLAAIGVSPWRALWYVVLPIVVGQWFLIAMNYLQHAGCDHAAPFGHSANHTGRLFNLLLFNLGFHTAHHGAPEAHWSELPMLHQEDVAPVIDPALVHRSFLGHLIGGYVVRFDER